MATNDTTTVLRIKETVAGASPTPNVWVLATVSTGELAHLKIFVTVRDNSDPSVVFTGLTYDGLLVEAGGSADAPSNVDIANNGSAATLQILANGADLTLEALSAIALIDVEICVEVKRLG
jgi:hypothetical protein